MLLEATITDLRSLKAVIKIIKEQRNPPILYLPDHLHKQIKNEWWNEPYSWSRNEYASPYWVIDGVRIEVLRFKELEGRY